MSYPSGVVSYFRSGRRICASERAGRHPHPQPYYQPYYGQLHRRRLLINDDGMRLAGHVLGTSPGSYYICMRLAGNTLGTFSILCVGGGSLATECIVPDICCIAVHPTTSYNTSQPSTSPPFAITSYDTPTGRNHGLRLSKAHPPPLLDPIRTAAFSAGREYRCSIFVGKHSV